MTCTELLEYIVWLLMVLTGLMAHIVAVHAFLHGYIGLMLAFSLMGSFWIFWFLWSVIYGK